MSLRSPIELFRPSFIQQELSILSMKPVNRFTGSKTAAFITIAVDPNIAMISHSLEYNRNGFPHTFCICLQRSILCFLRGCDIMIMITYACNLEGTLPTCIESLILCFVAEVIHGHVVTDVTDI